MPTLIRWRDDLAVLEEDAFTAVADDLPMIHGDVILSLTRSRGSTMMCRFPKAT